MCAFCAAVPTAAAIGASLNAKQKTARKLAEEKGTELPAEKPIAKMTLGAIVLLTIMSVAYHLIISPILKI